MSIPRLAIHRPVTMFMLSGVIILIGALSLMKLPVDLMPDISFPSITVRVGYPGVGPLEMEELVTRPLEQALSRDDVPHVFLTGFTWEIPGSASRLAWMAAPNALEGKPEPFE